MSFRFKLISAILHYKFTAFWTWNQAGIYKSTFTSECFRIEVKSFISIPCHFVNDIQCCKRKLIYFYNDVLFTRLFCFYCNGFRFHNEIIFFPFSLITRWFTSAIRLYFIYILPALTCEYHPLLSLGTPEIAHCLFRSLKTVNHFESFFRISGLHFRKDKIIVCHSTYSNRDKSDGDYISWLFCFVLQFCNGI